MIDAVFFDLYETLITEFDARPPDQRSWRSTAAERLGIDDSLFERAWRACAERRITGSLPNHAAVLHEICTTLGRTVDEHVLQQLQLDRVTLKQPPFIAIEAEVLAALKHIKATGVKLGVISNCALEEVAAWQQCTLSSQFDDVVFSYAVGIMKPDPQIYALACSRLAVDPKWSIFIGDGGSDELTGAAQAGLTPYWATWFLDRWPAAKRARGQREHSAFYPQLRSLDAAVAVVERAT